eukprot:6039499-Amphidinium_carterae.1
MGILQRVVGHGDETPWQANNFSRKDVNCSYKSSLPLVAEICEALPVDMMCMMRILPQERRFQ